MSSYEYDIALSFAGEDRERAESLYLSLISRKLRVFYDKFEQHNIWGKDIIEYLHKVYSKQARYCIVLISKHYIKKDWTRHERKSAQERALHQESEYLLPIRLDDTPLPGLPETIGYIHFNDYTIDELADLVVRKLGTPLVNIEPIDTNDNVSSFNKLVLNKIEIDPTKDVRFLRHEGLVIKWFPSKEKFGYFALHSLSSTLITIPEERMRNTFLNVNRHYSEALHYAHTPDIHPDGYTRRTVIKRNSDNPITAEATACYFDGHIVTEGYLDLLCEGDDGFNPNWFIYIIQRHLQLSKEVFEDYTKSATCLIVLKDITNFKWEIYQYNQIWKKQPYVGYHRNVVVPFGLSEIHGRDSWNLKINVAEEIMVKIARMFGMDRLPQRYWNSEGLLEYPRGIPNR